MKKILKLGIVGGGPGSWIGNIHRIASRIDGKYKIYAKGLRNPQGLTEYNDNLILILDAFFQFTVYFMIFKLMNGSYRPILTYKNNSLLNNLPRL